MLIIKKRRNETQLWLGLLLGCIIERKSNRTTSKMKKTTSIMGDSFACGIEDDYSSGEDTLRLKRELADAKEFIIATLKFQKPDAPIFIPQVEENEDFFNKFPLGGKMATSCDHLSPELQRDRGIALAAFAGEHLLLEDLSKEWIGDRSFIMDTLSLNSKLWFRLPEGTQADKSLIKDLGPRFIFRNDNMLVAVFEKIPDLRDDADIWTNIISTFRSDRQEENNSSLHEEYRAEPRRFCTLTYAPSFVRSDRTLMNLACVGAPKELLAVERELLDDDSFLFDVLSEQPLGLMCIPSERLPALPDLVKNVVAFLRYEYDKEQNCPYSYQADLVGRLGSSFFSKDNMDLAETWFRNGGRFHRDIFPQEWRDRGEGFLWSAEYAFLSIPDYVGRKCLGESVFRYVSDRLRDDLEFMTKVAEYVNWPLEHGSRAIRRNMNVVVRALSHDEKEATRYMHHHSTLEWQNWNDDICAWTVEKIETFDNFHTLILPQLSENHTSESPLRMLAQGNETTAVYTKMIAEYVGVPTGTAYQFYLRYFNVTSEPRRWRLSRR